MFTPRILICALLLILALPASATISYFVDSQALYNTATSGLTQHAVSFDNYVGGTNFVLIDGVTFTGSGPFLDPQLAALGNPWGNSPSGTVLARSAGGGSIAITLPSSVLAVSFYFGWVNTNGGSNYVIVSTTPGGNTQLSPSQTVSQYAPTFVGVVTNNPADPITSVTISSLGNSDRLKLGGVVFDTAAIAQTPGDTAPEASTALLLGTGLAGVFLFGRRVRASGRQV